MQKASGSWVVLVVLVAVVMATSSLAIAIPRGPMGSAPAAATATTAIVTGGSGTHAGNSPSSSGTTLGISAARLATVTSDREATIASGGNLSLFEPPNLHQLSPQAAESGPVTPLYNIAPAPMGVGYFGVSNTGGGPVGTVANTTSLQAFFTTSDSLGVQTEEFDFGTQTAYGSQLNAVLTNVTILGQQGFGPNVNAPTGCGPSFYPDSQGSPTYCPNQFWLQNVINYNPATHSLAIENNIWNFSNPSAAWSLANGFTLHGRSNPNTGGYYAVSGPSFANLYYPFTVILYLNTTVGKCVVGSTGVAGAAACTSAMSSAPVNEVFFNYTVINGAGVYDPGPTGLAHCGGMSLTTRTVCGEYDDVFWNSIRPSVNPGGVAFGSSQITANGLAYDPVGLTNDWEMDWGIGTSSGATTIVYYADAQVGVNYCPKADTNTHTGKCSRYEAPPAAYDYGGETGETNIGASGYYTTESGGLPNAYGLTVNGAPVAHFVTGPSLLLDLWNTTTPSGAYALNYQLITPANAWIAIAEGAGVTNQSYFQVPSTFGWYSARAGSGGSRHATTLGANLYLPPGMYTIEVMLSGYDPIQQTVDLTSSGQTPSIALTPDASTGVYTPMWAYSASDLANLSVSGTGAAGNPYVMLSGLSTVGLPYGVSGSLSWLFSNLNDYLFTLWIGAYLNNTHAYATFNPGSNFQLVYPTWQWSSLTHFNVPRVDGLQYYLFHAQNVTVAHATNLYAWANSQATSVTSVVCNTCFNDLFANNRFNVSDIGVSFSGGTTAWAPIKASAALANTRNLLWGNTFVSAPQPVYTGLIAPSRFVTMSDLFDRVYNNNFGANLTISETSTTNFDFWNVTCQAGYHPLQSGAYPSSPTCQPSSYSQTMLGYTLTGSILGTGYQGGNVWFNYGGYANPYANIPYVGRTTAYNSGGIGQPTGHRAGDFAPLISFRIYEVPFKETGLPSSSTTTAFNVYVRNVGTNEKNSTATNAVPAGCAASTECVNFFLPNGTYSYYPTSAVAGYAPSPGAGTFTVAGAALGVTTITFGTGYLVTFTESGLPSPRSWYVNVTGQFPLHGTGTTLTITLANGAYTYTAASVPHVVITPSGSFTVSGAAKGVTVVFLFALPSASLNPDQPGEAATLSANPGGGSGTYTTYVWTGLPAACGSPGNVASFSCTPAASGTPTISVQVTDSRGGVGTGSFTWTINPSLAASLSPPTATTQPGEGVTFTPSTTGGVAPITGTLQANCPGLSGDVFTPTAGPETCTIYYNATDFVGSTSQATSTVTVTASLHASLSPPSATTQPGEGVTFTPSTTGGVAPITGTLRANCPGMSGDTFTPTSGPETCTIYYNATDFVGSHSQATSTVTVTSSLVASLTPPTATTQPGEGVTFTPGTTGGVAPVTATLQASCPGLSGDVFTAASGPETCTIYYNATDSVGSTSQATSVVTVTGPLVASLLPGTSTMDFGQSLTLTPSTSGGVAPITATLQANCPGMSGDTFTPTSGPETCTIYYNATDFVGSYSQAVSTVTVDPALSAGTVSAGPNPVDADPLTTIQTTGAMGGTGAGTYSYAWTGLPAACSSENGPAIRCTPTAAGTFTVTLTVTDGNGNTASASVVLTVDPELSAGVVSATPNPVTVGGSTTISTTGATGGTGAGTYDYAWTGLPTGCSSSDAVSISCTPTVTGAFTVSLTVTDGTGNTAQASFLLHVGTQPVTFTESNLPPGTMWFVNISGGTRLSGTTSSLSTTLGFGSYTYTVASLNKRWASAGGSFGVSYAPVPVPVTFSKQTYTVTFSESGLTGKPATKFAEKGWTVVLNGTSVHSTSASISFSGVPNGTLPVLVTGPAGFELTGSGRVSVRGTTTVDVTVMKAKTVTLSFHEKGLKGTSWCVSLDANVQCSTKATIKFLDLAPGTYTYAVGVVSGYDAIVHLGKLALTLTGTVFVGKGTPTFQVKYVAIPAVPAGVSALAGTALGRPLGKAVIPSLVGVQATLAIAGLLGMLGAALRLRRPAPETGELRRP
jgi:Thermopsin